MAQIKPEDAVWAQQMWEKLDKLNLEDVLRRAELSKTALDRALDDVKMGKKMKRVLANKARIGRPPLHHKTRKARAKKRRRDLWMLKEKPRRQAALVEELKTGEGWFKYLKESFRKQKIKSYFTEKEWLDVLYPLLEGGKIPVFRRIDTSKGMTLDNITMYESGTRNVIFCSEDYKLKLLGYAL